jgi:hypothetical protein
MASKSIQILVNEFPAATGLLLVVAVLAGRGWDHRRNMQRRLDDFAIAASTLHRFNGSTSVRPVYFST